MRQILTWSIAITLLFATSHANAQMPLNRLVGTWKLSSAQMEDRIVRGDGGCAKRPILTISESDSSKIALNGTALPVEGLIDNQERFEVITQPFNFILVGGTRLTFEIKGPDGIGGICEYVHSAAP
jgi:hypothetical protein